MNGLLKVAMAIGFMIGISMLFAQCFKATGEAYRDDPFGTAFGFILFPLVIYGLYRLFRK